MTKAEVRVHATRLGLRTADKPDSQDVCFINSTEGREGFLSRQLEFHSAEVVNTDGESVGEVEAIELVTVGQRRGMGHGTDGQRRYVVAVDMPTRRVTVGSAAEALTSAVTLSDATVTWVNEPLFDGARAVAQVSAHGRPAPCSVRMADGGLVVEFDVPQRPVAAGQTIALYNAAEPDSVVGAGIAA
jgi:tRNA-specific 2-thiouridylase